MTITLKIKEGCLIKQTFNKFGHGIVKIPLSNRIKPIMAQDVLNEVLI